jgi:hypothetical protein
MPPNARKGGLGNGQGRDGDRARTCDDAESIADEIRLPALQRRREIGNLPPLCVATAKSRAAAEPSVTFSEAVAKARAGRKPRRPPAATRAQRAGRKSRAGTKNKPCAIAGRRRLGGVPERAIPRRRDFMEPGEPRRHPVIIEASALRMRWRGLGSSKTQRCLSQGAQAAEVTCEFAGEAIFPDLAVVLR